MNAFELHRRQIIHATALAGLGLTWPGAQAQSGKLEKTKVSIAVGGKASFYYLPLTLAEQLGYFKSEGLEVEISDFAGWLGTLDAVPTIRDLHAHGQAVAESVVAENAGRWESLTEADRERIDLLARTVAQRLLHEPTLRLRDQGDASHGRIETTREIFGLDATQRNAGGESSNAVSGEGAEVVALPPRRESSSNG